MKSAKPPKAGKKPAKKRSASKSTAARSAPSKTKKSRISVSLLHHMPMNVSILFLNRINKFTAQGGDPDDTLKKILKELKSCFSKGDTPADRSVVVSLINRLHVAVFVPRRISMQTSVMSFGDPSLATSSQPPAIRKLKSVMKKSTDLFPAIVSCLKEESCQADEVITAYILSFLYNIVIALPQAQQIKATKACEKLGVLRILSAILRRHQTSVEDTVPNLYALRICEGCSLLMAFFGVFNSKVMLLLRLSKDLTVVRDFVEKMASKHLSGIVSSLNKGGPFQTKQTSDEELFILRVFLNLSISLFALSKGPQNAQELGVKTASLSARNITTLFQVLATKDSVEAEDVNHKGILICQLLQSTVFWQVALFHRITSCVVIRSQCCQEANELNLVTPLYRIFSESCTSDGSLPPNRLPRFNAQFTHLILLSLTELLLGDRGKTLEYLSTVGGLSAVVECVLKIDETKPTVWQQFLSRLSAMYGVSLLPAQPEKSALQLDGRRAPTGDGASHDQLLHVDVSPESFSPELSTDAVRFALPPLADIVLPRQCEIDAPAPMPSGDGDAAESGDREPLLAPTAETKVEVLKHQIRRLQALKETCHDEVKGSEHAHQVVFEDEMLTTDSVRFSSNFESGNLKRAVKVSENEYDLVLNWDTTTNSFTQWFFFCVEGFKPQEKYRFNILNMEKGGSSFNDGQRPLMLNVTDNEVSGWRRVGESIFYFRNNYKRPPRSRLDEEPASEEKSLASKKKKKAPPKKSKGATDSKSSTKVVQYFTVSLEIEMPKEGKCFLCNCYPFNYTTLRQHVSALEKSAATNFVKSPLTIQSLCTSPGGVPVPLLTITSYYNTMKKVPYTVEEIRQRPVVLLDARVHPGESNSSWVMKGLLDFVLCPNEKFKASVESLLSSVVIKAIPMINVDGVIMGNHRCSFYGVDLNRDYLHPDPIRNPVIYSMKQLLRQVIEVEQRPVVLYADFHGHSRAKNFLVYGCTPETIVGAPKEKTPTEAVAPIANEKIFPAMLGELCPMFSLKQSNYAVGKDKKGSARVVMYKEFNIRMSYGFEGTMMGGVAPDFDCNDSWENASKRRSIACGNIETHYNQINYQRFGESFVATLCALVEYKNTLLAEDVDESAKCLSSPMKRAWNTAKMAGSGKLGLADTQSSTSDERVAGSYVLASRQDRREEEVADCDVKDVVQAMTYLFPKDVNPIKETEDAEDDDGDYNDDEDVDDYLTLLQKQDTEDTGAEVPQSDLIEDVAEKEDNVSEGTASSSEDDDEGDANDEENRAKSIQDFEEEDAVVNTLPSNVLIL